MYLKILEILFVISGILLVLLLSLREFISSKIKDNLKVSAFVSFIAGILLIYIVLAILLAIFGKGGIYKFLMAFFGVSPFIIGRFASYEKIKIYSFIQILLAGISVICVYLF